MVFVLQPFLYLFLYPDIGAAQALFQGKARFPTKHLAQASIVRITPAHALWAGVMFLGDVDAGDVGHDIGLLVDGHHAILSEVERLVIV